MKVTLFGATGKTGKYLIDEALKRGLDVTVFARPATPFEEPRVRVVRGGLSDTALLRDAIRGSNAVLSALGPTSVLHPKDLPITRETEAIISAMRQEDITRLIACGSRQFQPKNCEAERRALPNPLSWTAMRRR